jgi:hypothetical protein
LHSWSQLISHVRHIRNPKVMSLIYHFFVVVINLSILIFLWTISLMWKMYNNKLHFAYISSKNRIKVILTHQNFYVNCEFNVKYNDTISWFSHLTTQITSNVEDKYKQPIILCETKQVLLHVFCMFSQKLIHKKLDS